MQKPIQALVALLLTGLAFAATSGTAWALPCTGGEKIIGKTATHWKCQDRDTGVVRLVLR